MAVNIIVGSLKIGVPDELVNSRNDKLIRAEIHKQIDDHLYCQNLGNQVFDTRSQELVQMLEDLETQRNAMLMMAVEKRTDGQQTDRATD